METTLDIQRMREENIDGEDQEEAGEENTREGESQSKACSEESSQEARDEKGCQEDGQEGREEIGQEDRCQETYEETRRRSLQGGSKEACDNKGFSQFVETSDSSH